MSYILDALKKSEMQARQGTLPDIHSHQVMQPAGAQRPGWQFALFGGAAACIVFAIGFVFLSGASDKPAPELPRTTPATLPLPAASPAPATDPTQTTLSQPLPASAPIVNTTVQETMPAQARPAAPVPAADTPAVSAAQPASAQPTTVQPEPEPAAQSDSAQAIRMPELQPQGGNHSPPLMSKLPVSVQESLPPIDISGHIYDEKPASRMVFINGHIQREGDTLPGGLRLLAITPNGVELSFRDTPFRIELFRLPVQH